MESRRQREPGSILSTLNRCRVYSLGVTPAGFDQRTFARRFTNYSAGLKIRIKPCCFGGHPDCSQCGWAVSAGLYWLHETPLKMKFKARLVSDLSLAIGRHKAR